MKITRLLLLLILAALPSSALGQYIEIPVSVKIIVAPDHDGGRACRDLDPTQPTTYLGSSSCDPSSVVTDEMINTAAAKANKWMDSYWRGYRYRIKEVLNVGGPHEQGSNGTTCYYGDDQRAAGNGPSCWWDRGDARDDPAFNIAIQANPTLFKLSSNAVNFYVAIPKASADGSGGACPIPPGGASATWCHGFVNDGPWWLVHETGHFFGLCHTQDACGIVGTLPDDPSWSRQQIFDNARNTNYNNFNSLSSTEQQRLVDDTYYNVMSYHEPPNKDKVEDRRTELQLDRFGDTASITRNAFASGKSWVVSNSGSDCDVCGSSTNSFRTLGYAVTRANPAGGDIILLRPGAYNQTLTITKPCTLRASRQGPVAIGTTAAPSAGRAPEAQVTPTLP